MGRSTNFSMKGYSENEQRVVPETKLFSAVLAQAVHDIFSDHVENKDKEQAIDWINWFVYETNYGQKDMQGRDENGNPICYDVKSLYEYIEQYRI